MNKETLEEVAVNFVLKHFLFPNELFFKMSKCSQNDYLLEEEFGLDNTTKYREILGFIDGAKWQAERMYSEEDIRNAMERVWYWHEDNQDKDCPTLYDLIPKHIQSLQQTEWDVEIEMECGELRQCECSSNENCLNPQPKLDADSCLILKKK